MDLTSYSSPGRDQFGRTYPVQIKFKDGEVVYGHIVISLRTPPDENGGFKTNVDNFLLIANIENWKQNINEENSNRERLKFDDDAIEEISVYKDY
jgi:hypothetical protein